VIPKVLLEVPDRTVIALLLKNYKKNVGKNIKKNVKKRKNVAKIKKRKKRFYIYAANRYTILVYVFSSLWDR